jgi:predicted GH43/DUF377 family glycosyl hydrolase
MNKKDSSNPSLPDRDRRLSLAIALALSVVPAAGFLLAGLQGMVWGALPALVGWGFLLFNLRVIRRPFFPYDRILSATSSDGLLWHRETGIRLDVGGPHQSVQVYFPSVIQLSDSWRMHYRAGGHHSSIATANSLDGLSWHEESELPFPNERSAELERLDSPWVVSTDGGFRIYYSGYDRQVWQIYTCNSADPTRWTGQCQVLDLGTEKTLPHSKAPSIVAWQDGWIMAFMRFTANKVVIYTAKSSDGLNWQDIRPCPAIQHQNYQPRNPSLVVTEDDNLRLYFSEYSGQPIGARLVSALSSDGISWQREEGVRISPGDDTDRHGIFGGQAVYTGNEWRFYYAGYWGRHWLEPYTIWRYRRRSS